MNEIIAILSHCYIVIIKQYSNGTMKIQNIICYKKNEDFTRNTIANKVMIMAFSKRIRYAAFSLSHEPCLNGFTRRK